jgi:formylmethanofuran dehydrogenase subunit E
MRLELKPIGVVRSPYKYTKEAPPQGGKDSKIVIHDEYKAGLKDIEGFSHLHVLYWLHKSKSYSLSVMTPWDSKPHGLFTTRTPRRPNPIGHSVVQLIKREGCLLTVKGLDAIDGTPVLDIKPYVTTLDSKPNAKIGWLKDKKRG